ncbi:MAG TPA: HAMP domain-containing sensor histidine kinase [Anaerolineaceae bacterium]|nr:HAMP domain-containing sensor histidine kinase [Anaerolineaceae bacterium]
MHILDLLHSIRPIWINRTVQVLVRGAGVRDDFRGQLERFFDLLEKVVETGDKSCMDPILSDWSASLTQSDLEGNRIQIVRLVGQIFNNTYKICMETLPLDEAAELMGELTPCFSYAFEKAAQFEMQARIAFISNRLNQIQQSLERLDRSKSDFIAIAAHELRTPLTLVDGYASMMREMVVQNGSGEDSSEIMLLNGINNGTRRLRTIIDDMIDVSLIDNNLLNLNFQPVWTNRLLSILKLELESYISERRQMLEIRDFPGSGEMTFGDPERLLQVFRNVLLNAIKYTPDEGRIRVDGRKLPGFLEVIVTDTGIGIDNEDQQIIFEKFGRLGNSALHSSGKTKFKGGGPGLGLHIAKGIIESHGGAIWVESPGYDEQRCPGSIFHILLPMRQSPPDDKTAKLFEPLTHQKANG